MNNRADHCLLALISAARNGAETLSADGRPQDRVVDSEALWAACRPFLAAARVSNPPTLVASRILEIFGE